MEFESMDLTDKNDWKESEEKIRVQLDEQLSMDPIADVEGADEKARYCSVVEAAKIINRSPRQVQRLVKEGRIKGHKRAGRTGPEWMIKRADLNVFSSDIRSPILQHLSRVLPDLDGAVQLLNSKVASIESSLECMSKTESMLLLAREEICHLKDRLENQEQLIAKLTSESQSNNNPRNLEVMEGMAQAIAAQGERIEAIAEKTGKGSWWQRAFVDNKTAT